MDANLTRAVDEMWEGSDRWRLPTDNSGLESIGQRHLDAEKASMYKARASLTSAISVLGMIFVALFHLSRVNKRLGVTVKRLSYHFRCGELIATLTLHRLYYWLSILSIPIVARVSR